ncbi:hypothetical protein L2E82_32958 [Cichorium intybus]|uniref:Uncharacterized protein n=1 Tax=Cichorium intybus TaxID=13427 RepID=A0ACB9BIY6_CICIN|nr:hypothetical protein L2E82_32958 [Cichorium intybus]
MAFTQSFLQTFSSILHFSCYAPPNFAASSPIIGSALLLRFWKPLYVPLEYSLQFDIENIKVKEFHTKKLQPLLNGNVT